MEKFSEYPPFSVQNENEICRWIKLQLKGCDN